MTKDGQYGLAVAYKDNFDPWKFVWGMSIQAGNPLVDGKTARLADPAVKKAYQTYFGWLTNDKVVDPAAIGWTNAQAVAAFAKGKTGYFALTTPTGHQLAGPGRGQGQVEVRAAADGATRRHHPAGERGGGRQHPVR